MNNKNLFDSNLTATLEQEIEEEDKLTTLRMDLDATLENAINELNSLQDEYSQESAENLVDLCKANVMSTIVGQFGIASILLEAKDGGSVTTEHNFEKGIVATEDDYKIVGIGCSKNTECMSEQEISEIKEVILSILKEKYKRPIEQSCNGYIIYFYEDEVVGDNIKNTIYVSYNEKTISISAFNYKEVNNASLYHLKKNDKQRMYKEALSAL